MTDDERDRRIAHVRAETEALRADPTTPRKVFWLSFADDGFLGGCLIDDVVSFADAVFQSHERGCNPGGQVQGVEVDEQQIPLGHPRNILLSKAAIEAIDKLRVH